MAKKNRGKEFEGIFQNDWQRTFPNTFFLRLKDDVSMNYGNAKNPCDFLCMPKDNLFMIETKTHYDNRFPFSDLSQYESLVSYRNCPNVIPGVIIWFIDYDRVLFYHIDEITKMKRDGLKSINLRKEKEFNRYHYIEIPSKKKRVFMESDYSILVYNK